MVPIPPNEEIVPRRVRRAIGPYLKGAKNLAWALGVIQGQEPYALSVLVREFRGYGDTRRYRELREALERTLAEREGWAEV